MMRRLRYIVPILVLVVTAGCTLLDAVQSLEQGARIAAAPTAAASATQAAEATTPAPSATALSKAQILQLTLNAGLAPAVTLTSVLDAKVKFEVQVIPSEFDDTPDFSFITFDGRRFQLSEHRGKIVVVNFWASWCGPCRFETPDLAQVYDEYKDKGVVFAGVAVNDDPESSLIFLRRFNVKYFTGPDVDDKLATTFQTRALPTTLIIGRNGKTRLRFPGATNAEELRQLLDTILAEK